ncbi:hypothetical protein DAT35_32570 [Vitiosangium sp. GDMCC 1.1324]|nr:hypothetical protein DAT35_32570 [Vitiosangium sp. GDMCC 1.1324]
MGWALGLVPAAAGGGWAAFEWLGRRSAKGRSEGDPWADPQLEVIAWLCFAGEQRAAFALDRLLDSPTPNGPARLLRACLSMETGSWKEVQWHLAFPGVAGTPEARLLLALAERQPRASNWRHAFFAVWRELGKPDFRKSTLLPPPLEWNIVLADTEAAWKDANEAQRFALVVLYPRMAESRQEWVLEQVRASSSLPLLLALHEALLSFGAQVPLRQRLLPAVVDRLGQLAGPSPRTLQLALISFLAGSALKAPLTRHDLEALDKLSALPEWKQPSSEQFFLEMRALFEGLLAAPGHHAWSVVSKAQGVFLGMWLMQRAKASQELLSEDERRWMGRLLWDMGTRLRQQPSDLELDMGLRLQMRGSELTEHVPSKETSIAAWMELGRWEDAVKMAAFKRWPLASLQEESCEPRARNELVWMQAFAGKNELP